MHFATHIILYGVSLFMQQSETTKSHYIQREACRSTRFKNKAVKNLITETAWHTNEERIHASEEHRTAVNDTVSPTQWPQHARGSCEHSKQEKNNNDFGTAWDTYQSVCSEAFVRVAGSCVWTLASAFLAPAEINGTCRKEQTTDKSENRQEQTRRETRTRGKK